MSSAFSSIKQGMEEAVAFSKGAIGKAVVHEFSPLDVKKVRAKVDVSQSEFASAFGISVSTLHHWERGDHSRPSVGFTECDRQRATGSIKCIEGISCDNKGRHPSHFAPALLPQAGRLSRSD